jgi:hypothetical protein
VDLEHQRLAARSGRIQPALDLRPAALPSAVEGLDPGDLRLQRGVQPVIRRGAFGRAGRRARLERHQLGRHRRARVDGDHEVAIAAGCASQPDR